MSIERAAPKSLAPRVSVVIPTYNRSVMLCDSVNSVLAQSYEDLEVIVVDDGSTDDTRTVVERRYAGDPRVRYVHKPNGGPASAQNFGFRHARGELIGLNGDDDLWLPQKLELQIRKLDAHPDAGMCFSDCVFRGGRWDGRRFFEVNRFHGEISVWELSRRGFVPAGSVLMRKNCLDRVGHFDERLDVAEDWDLWIRMLADGPVVYVDQALFEYRQHSGPQACDDYETMLASKIKVLTKNEQLIVQSVDGPGSARGRAQKAMRRRLQLEYANYRGTQFKKLLQSPACPRRRDLLAVLSDSLRYRPFSFKHWRRYLTVLLFGSHLTRRWYCRERGSFGTERERGDRQKRQAARPVDQGDA